MCHAKSKRESGTDAWDALLKLKEVRESDNDADEWKEMSGLKNQFFRILFFFDKISQQATAALVRCLQA